jgi:hypothetical protein
VAKGARASVRALTGGPWSVSDRGESELTERAQRQGAWALTGGPRGLGEHARSGIPRSRPCDLNRTEGIRPRGQTAAGGVDRQARASGARARSGTHGPSHSI